EQVERLLLALEADRAGGGGRGEDQRDQGEQEDDRDEQGAADLRGGAERRAEATREAALGDRFDHPGEARDEQEVEGQDHERPLAAHPAAELLDADARHAGPDVTQAAEPAPGAGHRGHAGTAWGTASADVTWRNSSS